MELITQYVFEVIDFSSQYGSENGTGYSAGNLVGPCEVYPNYCDSNATCSFRTYGRWWRECPSSLSYIPSEMEGYRSEDYVDLYFDRPVIPTKLQIFETYNPGAIVRILACYRRQPGPVNTCKLHWVTLWKAPMEQQNHTTCRNSQMNLYHHSLQTTGAIFPLSWRFGPYLSGSVHSTWSTWRRCLESLAAPYLGRTRVFHPHLSNVPPYPIDLIRLELDSRDCFYFTELDAVRLTGWAEIQSSSTTRPASYVQHPLELPIMRPIDWPSTTSCAPSFFTDLLRPCTPRLCLSPNDEPYPNNLDPSSSLVSSITCRSPNNSPDLLYWLRPIGAGVPYPSVQNGTMSDNRIIPSSSLLPRSLMGWNLLLPDYPGGPIISIPPGTICLASLFGLLRLDERVAWRQGRFTHLPYELLLRIFSYLDLATLCKISCVSRQFHNLVDDAISRRHSLNLQSYSPWLTDSGLLSLGKRIGCVNLMERAAAAAAKSVDVVSPTAPIRLLRRKQHEEPPLTGNNLDASNRGPSLAARVRSWSMNAAANNTGKESVQQDSRLNAEQPCRSCSIAESLSLPDTYGVNGSCNTDRENVEPAGIADELYHLYKYSFPPSRLRTIDLSWCGNYSQISPNAFGNFLGDACRYLSSLRLRSCKFLNDDCILHIANTCGLLQELDLSSCTGISDFGFHTLGRLIHLRWISLYRTRVTDTSLLSLSSMCQHLEHVNLGSCMEVENMDQVLDSLTLNNPLLISLNLWRCVSLTNVGIGYITRSCPNLEELDVGWCRNEAIAHERACIKRLVQHCRKIRKLFLTGLNLLNSEDLFDVGQFIGSNLEQFDIQGSMHVSCQALIRFFSLCPRLRLLDVSFCAGIDMRDIIRLRYLYPNCAIVICFPDMNLHAPGQGRRRRIRVGGRNGYADDNNEHDYDNLSDDDDIDNNDNDIVILNDLHFIDWMFPPALMGNSVQLALPAPQNYPAIAGPSGSLSN